VSARLKDASDLGDRGFKQLDWQSISDDTELKAAAAAAFVLGARLERLDIPPAQGMRDLLRPRCPRLEELDAVPNLWVPHHLQTVLPQFRTQSQEPLHDAPPLLPTACNGRLERPLCSH
jgi:hypothetical protein